LGAVEYVNLVGRRLNLQLPSTLIFDYPTVTSVSTFLSTTLAARQAAAAPAATTRTTVAVPKPLAAPSAAALAPAPAASVSIRGMLLWPLLAAQGSSSVSSISLPQQDAIQAVPASRWNPDETRGLPADLTSAVAATRFGAFLQGVEQFDAGAFGLSGPESVAMDPQHRLLLASAAQLLATPNAFAAAAGSRSLSDTGVFVGISWTEYHALSKACGQPVGAHTAQGAVLSVACGRCVRRRPCYRVLLRRSVSLGCCHHEKHSYEPVFLLSISLLTGHCSTKRLMFSLCCCSQQGG
jgi:hypothetical protein